VLIRSAPLRSVAAAAVVLAACSPGAPPGTGPAPAPAAPPYVPLTTGLPAIPRVEGPVAIRVIHPRPGDPLPRVDSTFIYGSVGTGGAALTINGTPVPVAPNGAFFAYLPLPASGAWELRATRGSEASTAAVTYRAPVRDTMVVALPPGQAGPAAGVTFARARAGRVRGGADTLATGSDAVYARPSPTGSYRWFFPRGARLDVVERRRAQYRAQLEGGTSAWIDTTAVALEDSTVAVAPPAPLGAVEARPAAGWVDVRIPARRAAFLVEPGTGEWSVTVYGVTPGAAPAAPRDAMLTGVTQEPVGSGAVRLRLAVARAPWGYKAFYAADGALVVRLRRPPAIDPANPLRGRRIVIDPGHPPAGATGPTGLYEGDANLAISLPLAAKLRAAGAEVIMTRTTNAPLELNPRTNMAVRSDGEILVSVHNNAFGEAQNPYRSHGTSTYYFHPFSADLARALDQAIVGATLLPDLGARQGNLALVRPTWMPSALTESLFMPIPEQESALRDPAFVERLAEAHARGIEAFFRQRAEGQGIGNRE
jgi:N-acetylmuramoyl-L-alanine amidase